jgi:hypothetical protein
VAFWGLYDEITGNSRMLLSFEFLYLRVPLGMWSDLNDLVLLGGAIALAVWAEPKLVIHLIQRVPPLSYSCLLGTSKRKLCDHFLFCLPNPCFPSHPWVNFREALWSTSRPLGEEW